MKSIMIILSLGLVLVGCAPSADNKTPTLLTPSPNSCLFNNQQILNGNNVTAYVNSTALYGNTCIKQVRYCKNRILSGSAQYASCHINAPASCLFNGSTLSHGQSVFAYVSSIVPYGSSCVGQLRTCNNGNLSGTSLQQSCSVSPAPPVITPPNPTITVYIKYNAMIQGGCYSSPQQLACNSSTKTILLSYLSSFRATNYPYCTLTDKGSNLYEIDCRSAQTCQQYYSAGHCGRTYKINYLVGSCSSVYNVNTSVYSNCNR